MHSALEAGQDIPRLFKHDPTLPATVQHTASGSIIRVSKACKYITRVEGGRNSRGEEKGVEVVRGDLLE